MCADEVDDEDEGQVWEKSDRIDPEPGDEFILSPLVSPNSVNRQRQRASERPGVGDRERPVRGDRALASFHTSFCASCFLVFRKNLRRRPDQASLLSSRFLARLRSAPPVGSAMAGNLQLLDALQLGQAAEVQRLVTEGADVSFREAATGFLPLHLAAARGGQAGVTKILLAAGADVAAINHHGVTALMLAADGGHEEVSQTLLDAGADVTATSNDGHFALGLAVEGGHAGLVRIFLDAGANAAAGVENRYVALHAAAYGGHPGVTQLLLDAGADLEFTNNDEHTPLQIAACGGHVEVMRVLLDAGSDVAARDPGGGMAMPGEHVRILSHGLTALHLASQGGHVEAVRMLLHAGVDVRTTGHSGWGDPDGHTALHEAARGGHVGVAQLLLDAGVDVLAINKSGFGGGSSALHNAARGAHVEMVRLV